MVRHRLLPALAICILFICVPSIYADNVSLTSGMASTHLGIGTVLVVGNNFTLNYRGEIPPGAMTAFSFNSVTFATGVPSVSFNSISSVFFNGSLNFNNSLLSGSVTSYASMEDMFFARNPLFSVNFTGPGFMTIITHPGGVETRFTIATPEPTSLLLFTTALLSAGAFTRRRRRRMPPG